MSLLACYRPINDRTARTKICNPLNGRIPGEAGSSVGCAPLLDSGLRHRRPCGNSSTPRVLRVPEGVMSEQTELPLRKGASDLLAEISPDPISHHNLAQPGNCWRTFHKKEVMTFQFNFFETLLLILTVLDSYSKRKFPHDIIMTIF